VLASVGSATRATAEPSQHQRWRHGDRQCGEITFAHGGLRFDPETCRDRHGRDDRDDHHWGADAVLFEHSGFRGEALPLRYDIPDLTAFDFDDRASSIMVRRGRWEGCTEPRYRGQCWRVSGDDGGFAPAANNRIRSVRRVR
jgi:hypothetical protein